MQTNMASIVPDSNSPNYGQLEELLLPHDAEMIFNLLPPLQPSDDQDETRDVADEAGAGLILFRDAFQNIPPLDQPLQFNPILTALNFYARGGYQGSVAQNMDGPMAQQTVSRCLQEVTNALNAPHILRKYIKFPQNRNERNSIKRKFYEKYGLPGVIGCIDCTHIAIVRPSQQEEQYFNRKHFHSLNTQVMVRRGPPDRHEFGDELQFHLEIDGGTTNKRKYLYSAKLNRIYVNENEPFPIQFTWKGVPYAGGVVVRACVVFAAPEQNEKRVERCVQHLHDPKSESLPLPVKMNVLQSSRDLSTQGVHYCGEGLAPDSWLSVAVEYNEESPGPKAHAYRLVCKNSCSSGINRREIEIIFTLETLGGEVLGRRIVGIRGCSCPRRDMKRDEEAAGAPAGKRPISAGPDTAVRAKKIKVEVGEEDSEMVTLNLQLVGPRAAAAALGAALSVTELEAERAPAHRRQGYDDSIAAIKKELNKYRRARI